MKICNKDYVIIKYKDGEVTLRTCTTIDELQYYTQIYCKVSTVQHTYTYMTSGLIVEKFKEFVINYKNI